MSFGPNEINLKKTLQTSTISNYFAKFEPNRSISSRVIEWTHIIYMFLYMYKCHFFWLARNSTIWMNGFQIRWIFRIQWWWIEVCFTKTCVRFTRIKISRRIFHSKHINKLQLFLALEETVPCMENNSRKRYLVKMFPVSLYWLAIHCNRFVKKC